MTEVVTLEALSRAIDPGAWESDAPIPTRADTVSFHQRRQEANAAAKRVMALLITSAATTGEVERLARGLNEHEKRFLVRVVHGEKLGCADRVEDRARQACRRRGLVEIHKEPRRWVATPLGEQVRLALTTTAVMGTL